MTAANRSAVLCLALSATFACSGTAPGDPVFDQADLNDNVAQIRAVAHAADLVVVANVETVSPLRLPPSGLIENRQAVNYDVVRVLRGHYNLPQIEVHHLLVRNSRQHDAAGGLSRQLFSPGATLILLVQRDDIFFEDGDENYSALPHSAGNERAILHNM